MGRKQFFIGTIASFAYLLLLKIARVTTKPGVEGLTVVTLVGKPGTCALGKLFL